MKDFPKYDTRRVREMSHEEMVRMLAEVVLRPCYTIAGHPEPHENDIQAYADVIANDILDEMNGYRSLFAEEIKRAFWDGAKGVLGEYYGLNIKSFEGFLQKYIVSGRALKIHRLVSEEAIKWGPKQIEGSTERTQAEIDADSERYIHAMVGRINAGGLVDELFPCYAGSDFAKAVRELVDLHAPAAYIHEAVRLGMFDEAELMGNTFRSMRLMPAI